MCVDFVVTNHGGCARDRHQQSLNHVIRFHVKIVFLVMEIFVFCIQAKVTYCWYWYSLSGTR